MNNKIVLSIAFIFTINFTSFAQYGFHKVDVSFGVFAPILGYGIANVEYTLTDTYSVSLQVSKDFNNKEFTDSSNDYGDISISPAVRYYGADNEAKGFFFEGFLKYKKGNYEEGSTNTIGGGLGFGYKKVTSFGLLFGSNIGAGYGYDLTNSEGTPVNRGALFVGWRF